MKRSTFLSSLLALGTVPFIKLGASKPPDWVKKYDLVKTGFTSIDPTPKHLFDKLNVVEFVPFKRRNDQSQVFIDRSPDLNSCILHHAYQIQAAIIHSKEQRVFLPDCDDSLYNMSGFIERYGREPLPTDKIRILFDRELFNITQGQSYRIVSVINFELV